MISTLKLKKSNIVFGTVFILVALISILSLMDAPEYVRCEHMGICEFLDLAYISHTSKEVKSNWLKNSIYGLTSYQLTSIKNHTLLDPFYILKRYINPYLQKIRRYLHEKPIKILINKIYIAYKKSPILFAKRIHIITSSVVRS